MKTGGRQKGTPNKSNATIKEFVQSIIDTNRQQVMRDIAELEAKDRVNAILKLLDYFLPKQTASSNRVDLDRLTDEQVNQVIESIAI